MQGLGGLWAVEYATTRLQKKNEANPQELGFASIGDHFQIEHTMCYDLTS